MKLAGKIGAIFLGLLAVPLFTIAACNIAMIEVALNPDTYAEAFDNQALFDDMLPIILPALIEISQTQTANLDLELDEDTPPPLPLEELPVELESIAESLTTEDWRNITGNLVPSEWVQEQFTLGVDVMLGAARGDNTVLDEVIDLSPIRENLMGDAAESAAVYLLQLAPACTNEQIAQIEAVEAGEDERLPLCQPPARLASVSFDAITGWLAQLGSVLPANELTIREFSSMDEQTVRAINLLVDVDRQILLLFLLCPAGLMALVVFLAVESLRGFGRWTGTIGIVTGMAILLMIGLLQIIMFNSATSIFDASSDAGRFAARLTTAIIRSAFTQSSSIMLLQAGFFVGAGFILLAIAFLAPDRSQPVPAGSVIVTDDGQILSTASQKKTTRSVQFKDLTPP